MNKTLGLGVLAILLLASACQKPMASFLIESEDRKAPTMLAFNNKSENADSYEWDFGDGTTSSSFNAEHQYSHSGRYIVTLKAMKGSKVSTSQQEIILEAPNDCHILMETSMGNMTFRLSDATPQHRDNFIKLTKEGFYEGLIFHRVIQGFMAQGGDPNSKNAKPGKSLGSGGPGYTIPAEFVDSLVHIKGALAAARLGDGANPEKNSSGSQFYVVHGKPMDEGSIKQMEARLGISYTDAQKTVLTEQGGTPFLDKNYTVYGQLVKGFDVLDAICNSKTDNRDRPSTDVIILKMSVIQ